MDRTEKVGATERQWKVLLAASRAGFVSIAPNSLRFWRIFLEHLLNAFVQVLDVAVRLVRDCATGRSPPKQFFRVRVEEIDHEGTNLIGLSCGGRISESSAPAPTAAKSVVKSVESLLSFRHSDSHDGNIATGINLR